MHTKVVRQRSKREADEIHAAEEQRHAKRTAAEQAAKTKWRWLEDRNLWDTDIYFQKHFVEDKFVAASSACGRLRFW